METFEYPRVILLHTSLQLFNDVLHRVGIVFSEVIGFPFDFLYFRRVLEHFLLELLLLTLDFLLEGSGVLAGIFSLP